MSEEKPKHKDRGSAVHCDFCRRDISTSVRIRCAVCEDLDLCVECFASGMEIVSHRRDHSYRVLSQCKIPLFDPEWGADEEMALIEGLEFCGIGNWADISEYVQTKNKQKCEEHYTRVYLTSKTAPLPELDLTQITNESEQKQKQNEMNEEKMKMKSEEKTEDSDKMAIESNQFVAQSTHAVPTPNAATFALAAPLSLSSSSFSSSSSSLSSSSSFSSSSSSALSASVGSSTSVGVSALKKDKNKKSKVSGSAAASSSTGPAGKPRVVRGLGHLVGYIPARGDFDTEYDNEAELILADMEFRDDDTKWERDLKLKVLDIYNGKLDARAERKKFILERGLLERKEKKRSKEEREIYNAMRVFARFHSAEQHEQWIQGLLNEQRLRRRIEQLQMYRMNGIRTLADGEMFDNERKKKAALATGKKKTESAAGTVAQPAPPSATATAALNAMQSASSLSSSTSSASASVSASASLTSSALAPASAKKRAGGEDSDERLKSKKDDSSGSVAAPFDLSSLEGFQLLSAQERQLCELLRLPPTHYFSLKERIVREAVTRGFIKEPNSATLLKIDINKNAKTFDCFVSQGYLSTQASFQVPHLPVPPAINAPTLTEHTVLNTNSAANQMQLSNTASSSSSSSSAMSLA